jgi:23S rRNA (pseudouridine1915-N3)-methyltransferase
MKIKFICIGKTGHSFLEIGELEYLKRLKHYVQLERIEIPDIKQAKNLSNSQIKELEGREILAKIKSSDVIILLDEKGEQFTSLNFSDFIQQKLNTGIKTIAFIVGGAYGFSEDVYRSANSKLSLSEMTFSHQMIRMIFLEQLYRAFTILRNEPYHHQ